MPIFALFTSKGLRCKRALLGFTIQVIEFIAEVSICACQTEESRVNLEGYTEKSRAAKCRPIGIPRLSSFGGLGWRINLSLHQDHSRY